MVTGKLMDCDDNIDAVSYPNLAVACPDSPATV